MGDTPPSPWQTGLQRAQHLVEQAPADPRPTLALPPPTGDRRIDRKLAKRWAKLQRQQMEAQAELLESRDRNVLQGWVMLATAAALGAAAFLHGAEMWWLLFPAFGIGMGGAGIVGGGSRGARAPPLAPPVTPGVPASTEVVDPRDQRVEAICDRILKELQQSPEMVRELIRQPEETVKTLRGSCRQLSRRERDLRGLSSAADDARLLSERDGLVARLEAEADPVAKQRWAAALEALDDQRKQRVALTTAASRLEAEHTRLTYSLESLYTQIIRVRSADAASADAASAHFRRSLDELGAQMNAVADALESVTASDALTPVVEVGAPAGEGALRSRQKLS